MPLPSVHVKLPMVNGWACFWSPENRRFLQILLYLLLVSGIKMWRQGECNDCLIIFILKGTDTRLSANFVRKRTRKVAVVKPCNIWVSNIWISQSFNVSKCGCQEHFTYIHFSYNFVNPIFVSLNFKGAEYFAFFFLENMNRINLWLQVLRNKSP